ncbi:MAG: vWA domain-containing protein [Marinagarivorans sp.]|nr:vWA domain-containing protein [Marinagarivorans sp.]
MRFFSVAFYFLLDALLIVTALMPCSRAYAAEAADVRLVIDVSGSMKRNDPQNLRQPAVNLLMDLLPEGSRAGVWTFGRDVNMLVPFADVNDAWRDNARQKAADINSVGLYTNIGGALEKATAVAAKANQKSHIILLTDGMVDIDKNPEVNQKEWRRIVDKVLPKLKQQGFVVHTVALSDNADTHLMRELSLATGGQAAVAKMAEELMPAFLAAFDAAAPAQQVPLSGNRFLVDSSVEEFTALMFRDNAADILALVGPDESMLKAGQKQADVAWHHTENFDLVTITRPLEGEWQVEGELAKGSRITVVSDLSLRVKPLPMNAAIDSLLNLQLALQEADTLVTRKDFLQLLSITATSTPKDGKPSWQKTFDTSTPPANGVFTAQIDGFKKSGEYQIQVVVDGKTFKRRFAHTVAITVPFELRVSKRQNANSQLEYLLSVHKNTPQISTKNTQMAVTVIGPDRRQLVQPLLLGAQDEWQYVLQPTLEGQYRLQVKITGIDDAGRSFEYVLDEASVTYAPGADFESLLAVTASSSASSEALEIIEPVELEPAAVLEPLIENVPVPTEAKSALPSWMLYAALAVGNLVLMIGGILIFKRMLGGDKSAVVETTENERASAPQPFEAVDVAEEELDQTVMEMEDLEDEIPPMEDLEPDIDFDEDDEPELRAPSLAPQTRDTIDENFDFDLSSINTKSAAFSIDADKETESQPLSNKQEDDESKAQALDATEDELDDAISNLIDELDDSEDGAPAKNNAGKVGEINLDDFDFGDDDEFK